MLSDLRRQRFPSDFSSSRPEYPLVRSMLSEDPTRRPEASEILELDFMQAVREEIGDGDIGDGIASNRRKRRNTSASGGSFSSPDEFSK